MNQKDQEIIKKLKDGLTFQEIQQELHVSPTRISIVKKAWRLTNHNQNNRSDDGNGSESSENGSTATETESILEAREKNVGSETPEMIAERLFQRKIEQEKYLEQLAIDKRKLEIDEEANKIRKKELQLQEEHLQVQKLEAEKPKKLLLSRLIQIMDGYEIDKLNYSEVVSFLKESTLLKREFQSQYYLDNKIFTGTIYEKTLNSLLELFTEIKQELDKKPRADINIKHQLTLLMIRANMNMFRSS